MLFTQVLPGGRIERMTLPTPAAEGPRWSPQGSRLVFVGGATMGGQPFVSVAADLYVVRAGGGRPLRITHDAARETGPAWSPDGKRIVFARSARTGNRSSLWIVGGAGRGVRRLTFGNVDLEPSWASDGKTIVFVRIDPRTSRSGIWQIRPTGSGLRRILPHLSGVTHPLWSPDGSRLLLSDGTRLFTVSRSGSRRTLTRLWTDARGGLEDPQPGWTPDGRWVVFCQLRRGAFDRSDIWRVRSDGTGLRRLTRSPGLDTDPSIGALTR